MEEKPEDPLGPVTRAEDKPSESAGPAGAGQMRARTPSLLRNRVSLAGMALTALIATNFLFLVALMLLGVQPNPYAGIVTYLIFPAAALIGLGLIPLGALFERRRRRKLAPKEMPPYPRLDLNTASGRRALGAGVAFFLVFIAITTAGSYYAYQFTDTVTFCGQACHAPMKPEFTAYHNSPHARVACVDCHVGTGATWYLRAKLSGFHRAYVLLVGGYPRPITTPIKSLRPVREACERCHWPKIDYGEQFKLFTHYATDEKNTQTDIEMLIETGGGGGEAEFVRPTGIHWHMKIANRVWFIASDRQEQRIPWVKVKTEDGRLTEYQLTGSALGPGQIAAMPQHLMDCVTCHSRPSHEFRPVDQAVDQALAAGKLDPSLPYLKRVAVKLLAQSYPSSESALKAIATGLDGYYAKNYPQVYQSRRPTIREAIATVRLLYQNNIFPNMKVDWRTHPDNIGHLYYPGCFRCHDGKHVSADGRILTNDCESCHSLLAQRTAGKLVATKPEAPFKHPIELSAIKGLLCSNCHRGGLL